MKIKYDVDGLNGRVAVADAGSGLIRVYPEIADESYVPDEISLHSHPVRCNK